MHVLAWHCFGYPTYSKFSGHPGWYGKPGAQF